MSNSVSQAPTAVFQVLTVDDETYVCDLVSRWIKGCGHECAKANSVDEALEYVRNHPVDLIVSDISMPGRNGLELLEIVHQEFPDIAILMMTGVGEAKTAIAALTHGAWGYLVKPVERQELTCQVNGALERRQLRMSQRDYTRDLEEKVRQQTQQIRSAHEETIFRLVAASLYRDEETGMHIKRTGLFSEALALAAGWSASEAEILRLAAPMHDVGKIGIPDAILRKPDKLTPEEFEVMKKHTLIGAKMLEGSHSAILAMAREIAMNHHERWDGTGYPRGLAGEAIPEVARIVSIVDVYDALSHDRVYHKAMAEEDVLNMMKNGAGTQFDPGLTALFLANYETIHHIAEANPDNTATEPFNISAFLSSSSLENAPTPAMAMAGV